MNLFDGQTGRVVRHDIQTVRELFRDLKADLKAEYKKGPQSAADRVWVSLAVHKAHAKLNNIRWDLRLGDKLFGALYEAEWDIGHIGFPVARQAKLASDQPKD